MSNGPPFNPTRTAFEEKRVKIVTDAACELLDGEEVTSDELGRFSVGALTCAISNHTDMATTLVREALGVIERDGRPFGDDATTIESGYDSGRQWLRQIPSA